MQIAQIAPLTEAIPPKLYGGTERVISWLADELVARTNSGQSRYVRFVPKATECTAAKKHSYSITSSARPSSGRGIVRPRALAVLRLIIFAITYGSTKAILIGHPLAHSLGIAL